MRTSLVTTPSLFGLLVVVSALAAPAGGTSVDQILAGARRALGPGADSVQTIWSVATVTAPSGQFEVRVASARDGRVRMEMGRGLVAGVEHGRGWICDSLGQAASLDSITRSFVRGHDLHMLTLEPSWLTSPEILPSRRFGADSVMTVRFRDELGAPLLLHLRASDTLAVGLEVVNHTGSGARDVAVYLDDWETRRGVRLFRKAVFVHGASRFEYDYRELEVNTLPDSAFGPGCGR